MDGVYTLKWKIENFSYSVLPTGGVIYSSIFAADTPFRSHWRLELLPNEGSNPSYVSCYLECHSHNEPRDMIVSFWISLLDDYNRPAFIKSMENVSFVKGSVMGFPELIPWPALKRDRRHYLPSDVLTIQCHLKAVYPPYPVSKALLRLSETFRELYLNKEFPDLILKSDDDFPVHRNLISARAPTFSQELSLGNFTHEPRTEVLVDDVPSRALNAFLIYLYSGVLESPDVKVCERLCELAEQYELFDLQRDVFPTPTLTSTRTRIERKSTTIIFPIQGFSTSTGCSLSSLVDLGFVRIGIEYVCNRDVPGGGMLGFLIWWFLDDHLPAEQLFCSVSALDTDGVPCFSSMHEIKFDTSSPAFLLPTTIMKEWLMNDNFLQSDTLSVIFQFTAMSSLETTVIEVMKESETHCLERKQPSARTLSRLSMDLEQLVEWGTSGTINPYHVNNLQKAIFSAWSPIYAVRCLDPMQRNDLLAPINTETDIGKHLLRFLCTGRTGGLTFKSASGLYDMGQTYQIDVLRQVSMKRLISKLSEYTVIDSLIFAYRNNVKPLFSASRAFVCQHKDQIFLKGKWQKMSQNYPSIVKKVEEHLERISKN